MKGLSGEETLDPRGSDFAAQPFDLDAYTEAERGPIEAALARAVERWSRHLPETVAAAVGHGVFGGGKRLRPLLCVTAYRAAGGTGEGVYDLAASLEMVHAYSLMHDDLPCMDDAPLRRGRPTTHRVHGEGATVLAGAALIPLAALQVLSAARVLGLAGEAAARLAGELCRAAGAGGMVGGQALDLLAEGERLSAPELDRLHRLKTGALLTASLRMGALAAGAPDTLLDGLEAYGRAIGLAFQIADDLLDATASAEELGKHPSDNALGKSTYVAVHGLAEARRRARDEVVRAHAALLEAGIEAPALHALADFVVTRAR